MDCNHQAVKAPTDSEGLLKWVAILPPAARKNREATWADSSHVKRTLGHSVKHKRELQINVPTWKSSIDMSQHVCLQNKTN